MPTRPQLIAAICRHGDYEQPAGVPSAHLPHPLTPAGREQARALGDELDRQAHARGWALHGTLFCSSLLRAYQTAQGAAERLAELRGLPHRVVEHAALAERSTGAGANLTIEQIEHALARDPRHAAPPEDWKSRADYRLPWLGAESLREAGARVAACLNALMAELSGQLGADTVVAVIGHGAAFRHAAVELGALAPAEVSGLSMHHARPVYLAVDARGWQRVGGDWKVRERGALD